MDTTAPAASATTPQTSATEALVTELSNDETLVRASIAAYKTGGLKALAALIPQIVEEGKKDISAVMAALPEIKAGYKTTEFWLALGLFVLNIAALKVTGKALPFDTNMALSVVLTVYTLVRGALKKSAMTAPAAQAAASIAAGTAPSAAAK